MVMVINYILVYWKVMTRRKIVRWNEGNLCIYLRLFALFLKGNLMFKIKRSKFKSWLLETIWPEDCLGPPCKMGVTLVCTTRMWLGINVIQVTVFANEGVRSVPLWRRIISSWRYLRTIRCRKRFPLLTPTSRSFQKNATVIIPL